MLNVGFIGLPSTTAVIKCLVVDVVVVVGVIVDVFVVVIVVVVVLVVDVVVVVVVVVVGVDRFRHLVLHGQHLPVRKLTHLFFLGWYLHSLQHFSAGPPMMLLVSMREQQNPH